MRIVYVVPTFYHSAGVERIITVKSNYLSEVFGHEVYIVTGEMNGKKPFYQLSSKVKFIDLRLTHKLCPSGNFIYRTLFRAFYDSKYKREFRKELENILCRIQPDISIATTNVETPFLYKIKSDGSIKLHEAHVAKDCRIKQPHRSFLSKWMDYYQLWCDDFRVAKYQKFITLTEDDKKTWRFQKNIIVIPNPVTIQAKPAKDLLNKRVIAAGRLSYEKGFDMLLNAWKIVYLRFPDWNLDIFGTPADSKVETDLKQQIKKSNLKGVRILPPVSHLEDEFSNSSLFVFPSRGEGFPLVLGEAMSCGLPCVSCDCQWGPSSIIENGKDGYLVKVDDVEEFASAMIQVMGDDKLRTEMGRNALIKSQKFSLKTVMESWNNLFQDLLVKKQNTPSR